LAGRATATGVAAIVHFVGRLAQRAQRAAPRGAAVTDARFLQRVLLSEFCTLIRVEPAAPEARAADPFQATAEAALTGQLLLVLTKAIARAEACGDANAKIVRARKEAVFPLLCHR